MKKLITLIAIFINLIVFSQASSKLNNAQNNPTSVSNPPFLIGADPIPDGTWRKYIKEDIKWETSNINGLATFIQTTGNSIWQPILGYVPVNNMRTLNINGVSYDLSANRTWNISFTSLADKPTSLSGYGITDAYPLVGNPSGFITNIPAQSWSSITGKPSFSSVAISGDYNDLINKPSIYSFTGFANQYTRGDGTYITFPTALSSFTNDIGFLTGITSTQINTALGYTPYNGATNINGYVTSSGLTSTLGSYVTTTSLTSGLASKENIITSGTTAQYWRGDKTWQTLNTSVISEGTNLYYTDTRARASNSAGTGISYNSTTGVITNSAPDQTVTLTGSGNIVITGTYPNFTVSTGTSKRQLTYSGVTDASGNYTVTFATPFSVAPNIQQNLIGGSALQGTLITSITATGFTIQAYTRSTVSSLPIVGVLSATLVGVATNPLVGGNIDVLITEK